MKWCQEKTLDTISFFLYYYKVRIIKWCVDDYRGIILEKIIEQGILYDFYGMLLTNHQRAIYEAAVFEDLSLSELSEIFSITRQGVHDLIKRCDNAFATYESKLHLLEKSNYTRKKTEEILKILDAKQEDFNNSKKNKISEICKEILEEL